MNSEIKRRTPEALVSLTLGIISILSAIFWYISIPTGILAIVFGKQGIKATGSKVASAGRRVGIIGICISVAIFLLYTIIVVISNIL